MIALLLAAALPWVEMSGGPVLLRESGRAGLGTGPMVRVELGFPVAERLAAEAWLSGAMESAPLSAPGDRALLGAGVGGRALIADIGQLGMWVHVGAGWGAPAAGGGGTGPAGFGGLLLSFQPFVRRFSLGLEADAVAWHNAYGLAVLPFLRCAF